MSLINTVKASAIDPAAVCRVSLAGHGGLSGPAVRPIAIAQLARGVRGASACRSIGMGGSRQRRRCASNCSTPGRSVVAVGTESFRDPQRRAAGLPRELADVVTEPVPVASVSLDLDSRFR